MSTTVTEDRLKRLLESGLRGPCRPGERVSQLRKHAKEIDDLPLRRLREVFSATADETRLKMLKLITNEELCACELMAALELTQPTTSHHLGILERSGLVTSRREGKWVFYRLAQPKVEALMTKAIQIV
jgi:ArsR family transcriptional regulator